MTYCPSSKMLFCGTKRGKIFVVDIRQGQILASFQAHDLAVSSITYEEFHHQVLSGSMDGELKIWNATDLCLSEHLWKSGTTSPKHLTFRGKRTVR
jgi:WD40 repeat protein